MDLFKKELGIEVKYVTDDTNAWNGYINTFNEKYKAELTKLNENNKIHIK